MGVDDDHYLSESDPNATSGKFLHIEVPNYNGAPSNETDKQMGSYLRLGAAIPEADRRAQPRRTGEDLARLVQGFVDDTRDRGTPSDQPLSPQQRLDPASPGNPPSPPPPDFPADPRVAESKMLPTKGGWRDHSDGNRITTTRGDKVEVIRGNYKMIVLGRQDPATVDLGTTAGWDVSGGLIDAADMGQTAVAIKYEWARDNDNRWGWTQTITAGTEDTSATAGNGKIISQTWVDTLTTNYGSERKRVHEMTSNTWVETIRSFTDSSGDNRSTVNCGGVSVQELHAGAVISETHSSDEVSNTTSAKSFIYNHSSAPEITEFDLAALMAEVKIAALIAEMKIGIHFDLHATTHFDICGVMLCELNLGIHDTFETVGNVFSQDSTEIVALRTLLSGASVEATNGTHTRLALTHVVS